MLTMNIIHLAINPNSFICRQHIVNMPVIQFRKDHVLFLKTARALRKRKPTILRFLSSWCTFLFINCWMHVHSSEWISVSFIILPLWDLHCLIFWTLVFMHSISWLFFLIPSYYYSAFPLYNFFFKQKIITSTRIILS